MISKLLETQLHEFDVALEYEVILDKPRLLIKYSPKDQLVTRALALSLKIKSSNSVSESVLSYVPGRGPLKAIKRIQNFAREYINRTPLKERGLYVVKRDIKNYTDSIPLSDSSPIWDNLKKLNFTDTYYTNLKNALRVEMTRDEGNQFQRIAGIPMGSPLTPWIANLYLNEFDSWMEQFDPDSLYIRYGDDILWITPNKKRYEEMISLMDQEIEKFGLKFNAPKSQSFLWSGNGFNGSSNFTYLGVKIFWNQQLGLTSRRRKELMSEVKLRIQSIKETSNAPKDMGLALNDLMTTSWRSSPSLKSHLNLITSPGEWRSIRFDIAREIHRAEFGSTRGYHFRKISWQDLIENYGWRPVGVSLEK